MREWKGGGEGAMSIEDRLRKLEAGTEGEPMIIQIARYLVDRVDGVLVRTLQSSRTVTIGGDRGAT